MNNLCDYLHEKFPHISKDEFLNAVDREEAYASFGESIQQFMRHENRKKYVNNLREKYEFSHFDAKAIVRAAKLIDQNATEKKIYAQFDNQHKCMYYTKQIVVFPFLVVDAVFGFFFGRRSIIIIRL